MNVLICLLQKAGLTCVIIMGVLYYFTFLFIQYIILFVVGIVEFCLRFSIKYIKNLLTTIKRD